MYPQQETMNLDPLLGKKRDYDVAVIYFKNGSPVAVERDTDITQELTYHTFTIVDEDAPNPLKALPEDPLRCKLTKTFLISEIAGIDYIRYNKILTKGSKIIR